jgi:hypothetical protein
MNLFSWGTLSRKNPIVIAIDESSALCCCCEVLPWCDLAF